MPHKPRTIPRKLPQQERSKITVEAILTATTQILVEEGYAKATTNRIAERAGVSIGSLYQYFPSKEALLAALSQHHQNEILSVLVSKAKEFSDAPMHVAIRELVKASFLVHAVNPKLHKVLTEQVPRLGQLEQTPKVAESVTYLIHAYFEKRRDQIRPRNLALTAFMLERVVETLTHAAVIDHPEFLIDGQLEQEITDLVLRYIMREPDEL
jgi:AcrR family transcriptional regulator